MGSLCTLWTSAAPCYNILHISKATNVPWCAIPNMVLVLKASERVSNRQQQLQGNGLHRCAVSRCLQQHPAAAFIRCSCEGNPTGVALRMENGVMSES
eukprot:6175500-Pleurochrysis_carterae.AAC.8